MLVTDLPWPLPGHLLGSSRDRDTELSEVAALRRCHSLGAPLRGGRWERIMAGIRPQLRFLAMDLTSSRQMWLQTPQRNGYCRCVFGLVVSLPVPLTLASPESNMEMLKGR